MSFDALPHAAWPNIAAVLPLPWPVEAAAHDLRWYAAAHGVYKAALPSVRDLAARWGWSASATYRLLTSPAWADAARDWKWRAEPLKQQRNSSGTAAEQTERANAEQSPEAEQQRNSSGTAAELTRVHSYHPSPNTRRDTPAPAGSPLPPEPEHEPADDIRCTGSDRHPDTDRQDAPASSEGGGADCPEPAPQRPEPAVIWAKRLPADVVAAVLRGLAEVKQAPINPHRCGTDAKPILALWSALGKPPGAEFGEQFAIVAKWARESTDRLAAVDIRGEGRHDGVDRHRAVATLAVQQRWSSRLEAAQAWAAKGATPEATPAEADRTRCPHKAWAIMRQSALSRERVGIEGYDDRHTLTLKHAVRALGGREAIAAHLAHAEAAWPGVWAAALDHIAAKLEAAR